MFKATLDNLSKIIVSCFILFPILIYILEKVIRNSESDFYLFPSILIIVLLIITYLFSPKSYNVDMDNISINRIANKFFISRKEIKSVKPIDKNEIGMAWRTMGNGGLFGYTGWYFSSLQGRMRWFVSQRKNYVMITMNNNKKFILSPDDVNGFIKSIQS